MVALSPSVQAVLDAAFPAYEDEDSATGEQHAGKIAAAALRALADQVVPEQPAIPEGDLTEQTYRWDERSGIRAHLLAIATELEGQCICAALKIWGQCCAQRPIPVSERLPEPGDCAPWPGEPDATPWCWAGKHIDDGWEWAQISMLGLSANSLSWCIAGGGWSHWLPANAIPHP